MKKVAILVLVASKKNPEADKELASLMESVKEMKCWSVDRIIESEA